MLTYTWTTERGSTERGSKDLASLKLSMENAPEHPHSVVCLLFLLLKGKRQT